MTNCQNFIKFIPLLVEMAKQQNIMKKQNNYQFTIKTNNREDVFKHLPYYLLVFEIIDLRYLLFLVHK